MAVSDALKLKIYNGALRLLGERKVSSVDENREPRYVLDDIWDEEGFVHEALEEHGWNFATRASAITYDPSIETEFGWKYVFEKPSDIQRLTSMCSDPYFRVPLTNLEFADEGDFWLSDLSTLYVKYVSNGDEYGLDPAKWTRKFQTYLETRMAYEAAERITNSRTKVMDLYRLQEAVAKEAKSFDAMAEGPKMSPLGGWVRSRGTSWRDGRRR